MTLLVLILTYIYCRALEIMYKLKALVITAVIAVSIIVEEIRALLSR